ncbi:MAG TPA: hypothetical protein VGP64_05210 [Polyangia bacterium]
MTLTAAVLAGCGSGSKAAGSVGGPCFSNGTCDTGLECLSTLCVQPAGAGGAGGAAGASGTAGTSGIAGALGAAGASGAAGVSGQAGAGGEGGKATGAGGAAAGSGGQAAGGAGAAGAAGSAAGGGGQSAAGANGSAGAGGACTLISDTFTTASTNCKTCLMQHCCEQFNACEMDPDCAAYIDIFGATAGDSTTLPLQTCASTNCPSICPSRIEGS